MGCDFQGKDLPPASANVETTLTVAEQYHDGDEIIMQFSADWCGPCQQLKAMANESQALQKHFNSTKGYFVIDIDEEDTFSKAWTAKANPGSIPTVIRYRYKDGKWSEGMRFVGYRNEEAFLSFLKVKWPL